MEICRINNRDVVRAKLREPRYGVWCGDVSAIAEDVVQDPVTIALDGGAVNFKGFVYRGASNHGRWEGRIVGGAGGLRKRVDAKFYEDTTFGAVLVDLLGEVGEALDTATTAGILATPMAQWQRARGRAGELLADLVDHLNDTPDEPGFVWRMTRAGEVLIIADTYPVLTMDHEVMYPSPIAGRITVAPNGLPVGAPTLTVGVTFNGDKVGRVFTEIDSTTVRQHYWPEEELPGDA